MLGIVRNCCYIMSKFPSSKSPYLSSLKKYVGPSPCGDWWNGASKPSSGKPNNWDTKATENSQVFHFLPNRSSEFNKFMKNTAVNGMLKYVLSVNIDILFASCVPYAAMKKWHIYSHLCAMKIPCVTSLNNSMIYLYSQYWSGSVLLCFGIIGSQYKILITFAFKIDSRILSLTT